MIAVATPSCVGLRPRSDTVLPQGALERYIRAAGNTDDEELRLRIVTELGERAEPGSALRDEAAQLAAEIDLWISAASLGYFSGRMHDDREYNFGVAEDSPLFPLTRLYRGRLLAQYANQYGHVWGYPERRRKYLGRAATEFEEYSREFPGNTIARMYLGERLPPEVEYVSPPNAPAWALHQREALERLTDIIEWWVDNRQRPDGSYGGGWGDDCEMWRSWVPVLIGFEHPKISRAQALLSEGMMSQPHMAGGYTDHVTDVQHTAEDSADTITPMMHLAPEDEAWADRALRIAELAETLWMGTNERGMLQLRSSYFSSETVDESPLRACDVPYNMRAVQPALLYWQRTGDPRLAALFTRWMDTWVDATATAERGKPAGIIPCAIHWPDGSPGGLQDPWWDPRNYSPPLIYQWPSSMPMLTNTLLLAYHMTGDEAYLEPLRSMAAIRMEYLADEPAGKPEEGSAAWCAARMAWLTQTLAKYRFLTGSTEFDELLRMETRAYVSFRVRGDREALARALSRVAEALRYNFPGYTSEVRWTDRLFTFPRLFGRDCMYEEALPQFWRADTDLLYASATGDPGGVGYFPLNAVRWLTPPRDIAALVTESGTDRFAAELFHFGDRPREMEAELYLLTPGEYRLALCAEGGGPTVRETVTDHAGPTRIRLRLPPRTLVRLHIEADEQRAAR